ncbi:MAG: S8 family serine peptidase [Chloroflexi bacterium]|nr:S8 family serine peptidase [Chloroflexota bacterium]
MVKAAISPKSMNALLDGRGYILRQYPQLSLYEVVLTPGLETNALHVLWATPSVIYAEHDQRVRALGVPNDPYWAQQWNMSIVNAPAAWDVITGSETVIIAFLDTGLDLDHEDLQAKIWRNPSEIPGNGLDDDGNGKVDDVNGWHFYHKRVGFDYVPAEDGNVQDDNGHGSHVAGIAAADTNNGLGVAGMCWGCRILPVKVLDSNGEGWYSDIIAGLLYAVEQGARVVNLSLGGSDQSQALQDAITHAHDAGALLVAAAGNDGGPVLYPAACQHVLAVAATDQSDQRASYSNHGPQVDIAAPGGPIYSTWWRGNYFVKSGTSMAAPHVSGAAALLWSLNSRYTNVEVADILLHTATDTNAPLAAGWDEFIGWGRLDVGAAVSQTVSLPNRLILSAQPSSIRIGGETAIVHALVVDSQDRAVPDGTLVTFAATLGRLSSTIVGTHDGLAETTLTSEWEPGTSVVTAMVNGVSESVEVQFWAYRLLFPRVHKDSISFLEIHETSP